MQLNNLKTSYAYDPLGRRVKTTAGGATVYHVYSGDECAADLDASGNPLRSYTWGQGIDNLLAMTVYGASETNTYYAVKDHLGSVQALVDSTGNVVESFTYDAWGNLLSHFRTLELSNFSCRYMFHGREYSTVSGLYNFRVRWYAPTIGRWLSKDPIGLEGGLNLYVFCGNDPVNFRDPWGLSEKTINVTFVSDNSVIGDTFSHWLFGGNDYVISNVSGPDDMLSKGEKLIESLGKDTKIRVLGLSGHGAEGAGVSAKEGSINLARFDYDQQQRLKKILVESGGRFMNWSCGGGDKNCELKKIANLYNVFAAGWTGDVYWGPFPSRSLTKNGEIPTWSFSWPNK